MGVCVCVCACMCGTNEEDDVGVEVDAELNAVDDLLPGPTRNPEVGDQSHDRHCEKPEEDKRVDFFRIMARRKHIKKERWERGRRREKK